MEASISDSLNYTTYEGFSHTHTIKMLWEFEPNTTALEVKVFFYWARSRWPHSIILENSLLNEKNKR